MSQAVYVASGCKGTRSATAKAAMAALGLGVELAAERRVGPRALAAEVVSILFLVALSLTLIAALRL